MVGCGPELVCRWLVVVVFCLLAQCFLEMCIKLSKYKNHKTANKKLISPPFPEELKGYSTVDLDQTK